MENLGIPSPEEATNPPNFPTPLLNAVAPLLIPRLMSRINRPAGGNSDPAAPDGPPQLFTVEDCGLPTAELLLPGAPGIHDKGPPMAGAAEFPRGIFPRVEPPKASFIGNSLTTER